MKKISEAKRDFSTRNGHFQINPMNQAGIMAAENGFEAGVEFALRWIPVEEDMPKDHQRVIIKWWTGAEDIGFYQESNDSWYGNIQTLCLSRVISWRLIEMEK